MFLLSLVCTFLSSSVKLMCHLLRLFVARLVRVKLKAAKLLSADCYALLGKYMCR